MLIDDKRASGDWIKVELLLGLIHPLECLSFCEPSKQFFSLCMRFILKALMLIKTRFKGHKISYICFKDENDVFYCFLIVM